MGKVRAAKSKVRTGCRTCKARRVKCDEAKPECNRCSNGGRQCGGYEIIAPKQVSHGYPPKYILPGKPPDALNPAFTHVPNAPAIIPGASIDETNYFGFFCRYTAPTISGAFPSQFFERFVPQLSVREPVIRYAATALGALQRAQERNGRVTLGQEEADFALRQYGKAIPLAREKLLSTDLASQRLALVVCVLFACFEIAQKRFKETAMHLENGLNLLVNVRHRGVLPSGWDTENYDMSDDAATLDREIARTFDRLDVQSTFVRSTRPKLSTDPIAVARKTPRKFSSLEQAREYLSVLSRSISTFRHEVRATLTPFTFEDEQRLQTQQMHIRHQMQAWNAAFGSWRLPQVPLPPNIPPPTDVTARAVLEGTAVSASILLETGVSDGSECIFDNFTSNFKLLVDLGQIAKDHPRNPISSHVPNNGSSFHIHMGSIPTVYIVALKCRDPTIRRRALALLESFPFREGMWDAPLGASLCRHIMEVEEEGYENITCAQDLPEKARIHEAMFDITEWHDTVPVYYKRRDFEGEYGSPGAWLNWSAMAYVPRNRSERHASHWRCTDKSHVIKSETSCCLYCGRHSEEIQAQADDIEWTISHWGQKLREFPPSQEDYQSSTHTSPPNSLAPGYVPKSGPPGRGPPELLRRPRTLPDQSPYSYHGENESFAAAFDGADLSSFANSLFNPPQQVRLSG